MNISVGNILHGFEVTAVRTVDEISSTCYEMRHQKTGAELVWMDSGVENKLFSIAFKTIPEDSTGVFHILEHSVLCGSENYPVKEPFVELLKSSLNTFLNAMTFPDKTMYPVSSRNKTDFINLSRIYLDAVFKPAILTNPNIFYQEGWHFEMENKDSEPFYNGVVFNEMKGAYSSVDRVADQNLSSLLFPDTCYGLSSGGAPEHIPELTYEHFLDSYRRHYHPSNSRIYLDGAVPLDEILKIIDEEYLSGFEADAVPVELAMQQPIESVEQVFSYEIGPQDDPAGKDIMMMGKVICDWSDREKQLAVYILGQYLTGSNDAPLKKALLESGLVQDVSMSINDGIAQPYMYLFLRNTSYDKREQINEVIAKVCAELLENGLDRQSLEAAINHLEFNLREGHEPIGLERAINSLSAWLYGGDPVLYLTNDGVFSVLREKLNGDYYAELLREFLVCREHCATAWCLPSQTLGEERRAAERQRVADTQAKWSEQDVEEILALNSALKAWQQTPDSAESLAKLPVLSLDEVNPAPAERITTTETVNGVKILRHPSTAKGIAYLSLYFDIADLDQCSFSSASLMAKLLGSLPTAKHTVAELDREIKTHIGNLQFSIEQYGAPGQTSSCRAFFAARCSILEDEYSNVVPLLVEILTETKFDQLEDIRTLVTQQYDRGRRMIIGNGHRYGMYRSLSNFSAEAALREAVDGYSFYNYLRQFNADMDAGVSAFSAFASDFAAKTFGAARLTLSITADGDRLALSELISALPTGTACESDIICPILAPRRKEYLEIPAAVSFATMGVNVFAIDADYSAELRLLSHIISYNHLWNAIRVQGGAYGAGLTANITGDICYYTYRDPNSSRSLGIFRTTSEFLNSFCAEEDSLDKSIIGCISNLDPLESAKESGIASDSDYFRGITHSYRCRIWRDLLSTNKDKLLELADLLDNLAASGSVCVIGSADILEPVKDDSFTALEY